MQKQSNRPDATGPMYCSECGNAPMRMTIVGHRVYYACDHHVITGRTLTAAEYAAVMRAS